MGGLTTKGSLLYHKQSLVTIVEAVHVARRRLLHAARSHLHELAGLHSAGARLLADSVTGTPLAAELLREKKKKKKKKKTLR
eukprot:NODE_11110_length_267_cov_30.642202_g9340_i0.p1 GENE.NODE_11110_length_267_cov_30.642202_g9340_i0~~NODE_11110_length_267_cov_30.642202_g9340_i0.p1  ORF type:complete len:89 (+),score=59.75 NODE_11110_length_267_cov_30.642202_g9340_i0:22-267(+)